MSNNQNTGGHLCVPSFVGVEELATILKTRKATIYHWKAKGYITPAIDTGRVIRFDLEKTLKELLPTNRGSRPCQPKDNSLDLASFSRSLKTRGKNFASPQKGDGNGTR